MRGERNPFGSTYDFSGAFLRNRCAINIMNLRRRIYAYLLGKFRTGFVVAQIMYVNKY
jgi:hypothetical protein